MKTLKKCLAMFLALLTLFSICSTSTTVFAAEYTEQQARTEYFDSTLSGYLKNIVDTKDAVSISEKERVDEAVGEVNSSVARTASTFSLRATPAQSTEAAKEAAEDLDIDHTRLTLELEDGENVAYLFSEPISFIDDEGNLVYKDTNIKTVTDSVILNRGYSYENGNNDYKAYFSEDSARGLLLVDKDGEEVRLVPNGTKVGGALGKVESDMKLVDSFEYNGVYGTDTVLRFLPQLNGCKEEIVLSSYQGVSDFSFTLYTQNGTIAAINSNGEVEIIDSATKDIITTFVAPFANDSSGGLDVTSEHYTDCTYELEMIAEGKYILTISVPKEYLESENTVYPVIIDPTTDNISMYLDTSVYSALSDEPQGANPTACFGKTDTSEYGKGRAMFYFKLPTDIKNYAQISSAKFWLRETTGRTAEMYVRPYLISESWTNQVTWDTQPKYYNGTADYPGISNFSLPRRNINSASTDDPESPYWYAFNIVYAVRAWTTGTTNLGLKFIAECEAADGDYLWRAFATKDHTTSSYRPYVVISYTNDTTAPTISSVSGNPTAWTKNDVTLTVTATDDVYGVSGIAGYSFDNGSTWQTSKSKAFSANKTVYIKVKDKRGNITSKTVNITKIDKTKPAATITLSPTSWTNGNVTATIKITDNAAIAKYTINGTTTTLDADGSECITSKTVTKTFSANSTVSVSVTDAAGNTCSTVSKSFTNIDKTAPVVSTPTKSPNTEWSNANVTVTNNATDALSGIPTSGYSFNGGSSWEAKTKTYSAEGIYTVTPKAKDNAGNIGTGPSITVKIDKTAPTASASSIATSASTKVTVTASDALSGLHSTAYSFNNGAWTSTNYIYVTTTNSINIRVRDKAGNIKSFVYVPDPTCPLEISHAPTEWTNSDVIVSVIGTDLTSYSFDGGTTWQSENEHPAQTNSTLSIAVKDINNQPKIEPYTISNIDKVFPVINSVTSTEGGWAKGEIKVIVDAEDDLSGISQYSFDGGVTWQEGNTITYTDDAPEIVTVMVKDNAGNEASWGETVSLPKYDNGIPASPDLYEQDGLVYISSRSFDFNEETDSPEHIEYKIENGEWTEYDGEPINIVRTYGATVYARVRDDAENISPIAEILLENTIGEYTASYTDIALGEGLFPVEFGRTYTSTNGWFFTFDANVVKIDDNAYVFTDFYGEKQYFIKNSKGQYLSVDEEELTVNADSYVLTYGDMTCTFDLLDGKINRITTDYLDTAYTWNDNGTLTITGGATVTFAGGKPTAIEIERENKKKTIEYNWTTERFPGTDELGNVTEKEIVRLTSFKDAAGKVHTYNYLGETELLTKNDTETITYYGNRVSMISQPNGAFVKYIYKDKKTKEDSDETVKVVIVSDSKGVTDTIPYSDGVYISSSLDSYSDKASYDSSDTGFKKILDATQDADNIDDELVYVVEEQEMGSDPNSEGTGTDESTPGGQPESDGENATDNDIGEEANGDDPDTDGETSIDNEAVDTDEGTENSTESGGDNNVSSEPETPLYEEIDEDTYAFYTYDNQKRVTSELKVLKANITIDENTTFESAELVAESKVTYAYVSNEDNNITEKILYEKSDNTLVIKTKECYDYADGSVQTYSRYEYINGNIYTGSVYEYCNGVVQTYSRYEYENGNVLTHSKYKRVGEDDILLYDESYTYNDYGNVATHTETQHATSVDAFDVTYKTAYTYDVWGMCTGTTVTCGEDVDTTITEYDLNGVTLSVTYNDERVKYTYNDFGSVTTETVVKVNDDDTETFKYSTTYTYDEEKGNLLTCKNPDGDTSYYHYDTYGNLTWHTFNGYYFEYNTLGSIMNANVGAKVVEKDEINEKDETNVKYEIEDEGTEIVAYNYVGAEQELSYIDYKNGQRINYTYDETTGNLLTVSQGETAKFSYSYDTVGEDEIITLTDSINSIIKVIENDKVTVKTSDGKTDIYSVENLYEDEEKSGSFNGKKIIVGSDIYTLKSEENKDSFYVGETDTEAFVKTYEDDYAGNLWKVNTANAVLTEYGYDDDKNVSTLKNTLNGLVQTFGYGYDDEGNITTETLNIVTSDEVGATVETSEAIHYEYDEDNQLLSAETADTKWAYNYDGRGNITSKTEYSVTVGENNEKIYTEVDSKVYKYEDEVWADKLTEYDEVGIEYDVVGNPTEYLGHNLEWSFGRQLTKFDTNTYTYNEDGIRTSKTVDNVKTEFCLDGTNIIEQSDGSNTLYFYYDSNDEIIGFTYNEAEYFYVKNAMSDIIGIVDSSGNLIVSYAYDAWGKVLSVTGSNIELGNLNPFRYRSYYYDSDIEMYYLQSRYYDPEVCRFINSDDVNFIGATGTVGSYNAFAYCENEPVNGWDPWGLFKKDDHYNETVKIAEKYFSKDIAEALGEASASVDDIYSPTKKFYSSYNQSFHFNTNSVLKKTDSRYDRSEELFKEGVSCLARAKKYNKLYKKHSSNNNYRANFIANLTLSVMYFGMSIHPLQDQVAHSGIKGDIPVGIYFGSGSIFVFHLHLLWGVDELDKPYPKDKNKIKRDVNTEVTTKQIERIVKMYKKYGLYSYVK